MTNSSESQLNWKNFKYMVFDVPNNTGTYEERYNQLGNRFCFLFRFALTLMYNSYIYGEPEQIECNRVGSKGSLCG